MPEPTGATTGKSGSRTYFDPNTGRRLPSVTTILGAKAKPALIPWASKMAATRAVEDWEIWQDYKTKAEKIDYIKAAHTERASTAGVRGTVLHALAERHANGENVEVPEDIAPLFDGYLHYLADHCPRFLHTEITFINRTVGYAGTADFVYTNWQTWNEAVIGDWKTSGTGPWPEWALQLAAYTRGEATLVRDGSLVKAGPMPVVSQEVATIVRILPGRYEVWHTDVDLDKAFIVFKALKNVYEFNKLTSKQAFRRG